MKKTINYICLIGLLAFFAASCSDKEKITPSEINNLTSESRPGEIILRWETPQDGTVERIQVNYYDPRLKKEVVRMASIYADSIVIPDTRARYPDYEFTVCTVSSTDDQSATKTIRQKSEPAKITTVQSLLEIKLTAADLSTNAQETSEGPIANLLDDNMDTFFHTTWNKPPPAPHWMAVNLNKTLESHYCFYYAPRKNNNNKPIDFDLLGSTDGKNWALLKNFTQEADGLPVTSTDTYTSPVLPCLFPFSHIRILVNATNNGTVFWTMSEFKFYEATLDVFNPETDEED